MRALIFLINNGEQWTHQTDEEYCIDSITTKISSMFLCSLSLDNNEAVNCCYAHLCIFLLPKGLSDSIQAQLVYSSYGNVFYFQRKPGLYSTCCTFQRVLFQCIWITMSSRWRTTSKHVIQWLMHHPNMEDKEDPRKETQGKAVLK